MRRFLCATALAALCLPAHAAVVYVQPPDPAGGLYQSARWDPDGSDYDQWVWDNFTLGSAKAITEIRWRGGFIYGGTYSGPVIDFTVEIYPSIQGGYEPDVTHPPLIHYHTGNNAGETFAGVFGGSRMYDYHYRLPAPFHAAAGVKYWVQIEANHHGIPEWGFAKGTGAEGSHFRRLAEGPFHFITGDTAFTLLDDAPTYERGDLNCNGTIDAFDIEPFTLALFDPAGYAAQYPSCDRNLADINADGRVDAFDIEPLVDLLFGP